MSAHGDIPFTPEGYLALIERMKALGYALRGFAGAEPSAAHLILRHDVDLSLERAAEMAALEARHGIAATYFVLVRSEFYNPAAPASAAALRKIAAGGHHIGLHFDAALHAPPAQERAAAEECALLESLVGTRVEAISFHRPPAAAVGGAERIAGRLNAYSAHFTHSMGYCSDSRGGWHHGTPLAHPTVAAQRALQLLTHPIWWMGSEKAPAWKLRSFLERRFAHLDAELARHCSVHRPGGAR